MGDFVIFTGDRGKYRLCNRIWHGGPDRPTYEFMQELTLLQAIILYQTGVAEDYTPGKELARAEPVKPADRKKNKPRFRVQAPIRRIEGDHVDYREVDVAGRVGSESERGSQPQDRGCDC